ncbi:LynF/TruF/PatF family peptide O-prenyltransferase [Microcoleus sp. bin38.metabat.b11b12b14.051]|uniref:LynF/TruF/PatF family peptide O-prenyltransferase n=1 Tax=Microcoleus sp. bin38.metabat.b11b12b14.051 TaxID=2742709 RepID=UPI0025E4780D|nr:LynF/TruF/PatF family peptide O-prenyltransferase [Microcoleus sp. bin38.metabat.b11b12b14.051]
MLTYNNILNSEAKLHAIGAHKNAFEIESLYPLDIFEQLVAKTGECGLEFSCKIERERLYPARFNLSFGQDRKFADSFQQILSFFHQVAGRVGVTINYDLLQEFLGHNFDWSKVEGLQTGVDLRPEIPNSRLKLIFRIKDYPERLETAIALNRDCDTEEFRALLIYSVLVIGFDFFLDGRSEIELYPEIQRADFQRIDVQQRLLQVLSLPALQPLEASNVMMVGFSKANPDNKIVYYSLEDKNNFLNYFSANDLTRKVHAFYQQQPVLKSMWIGLAERELSAGIIQNINLYYNQSFVNEKT